MVLPNTCYCGAPEPKCAFEHSYNFNSLFHTKLYIHTANQEFRNKYGMHKKLQMCYICSLISHFQSRIKGEFSRSPWARALSHFSDTYLNYLNRFRARGNTGCAVICFPPESDYSTGMSGSMCTRFRPIPPESPIINNFQSFFVPFRDYSFTQRSVKKNTWNSPKPQNYIKKFDSHLSHFLLFLSRFCGPIPLLTLFISWSRFIRYHEMY